MSGVCNTMDLRNLRQTSEYPLSPPSLEELVDVLKPALDANFKESSVSVSRCPDLREAPFHLAARGLTGRECIADIGGQPNLFPEPRLDVKYSMISCARQMGMSQDRGMLIGAGAGPWFQLNTNSELAPNFSWEGAFDDVKNQTYFTKVDKKSGGPVCDRSPSTDCALMSTYTVGYNICLKQTLIIPNAFSESVWLCWSAWSCAQDHRQRSERQREELHRLHPARTKEQIRG